MANTSAFVPCYRAPITSAEFEAARRVAQANGGHTATAIVAVARVLYPSFDRYSPTTRDHITGDARRFLTWLACEGCGAESGEECFPYCMSADEV